MSPFLILQTAVILTTMGGGGSDGALRVHVKGQCPRAEQVNALLANTLPGPYSQQEQQTELRIEDAGGQYVARVGGEERVYLDEARHCDERARTVAIFATLVLRPPTLAQKDVQAAPEERPAENEKELRTLTFGVSLAAEATLQSDRSSFGTDMRALKPWGGNAWALVGGLGLRSAYTTTQGASARARLYRAPIFVGARGTITSGKIASFIEATGGLEAVLVEGTEPLRNTQKEWRLDPIVQAWLGFSFESFPTAPFMGFGFTAHPWPLQLHTDMGAPLSAPGLFAFACAGFYMGGH